MALTLNDAASMSPGGQPGSKTCKPMPGGKPPMKRSKPGKKK
ncbi:hypothetical protein CcrColossus_gp040 [Caulobacter phage CcrColossus]|uniref:Uncharacterized protein n=1 Tax=Caulobacter phage CcrColossus TaxID=1211640 RepID=K4JUB2_9CAUD|nr:hypothetical protein CcrColossus_gp040 [Caulobacter phage CcrColossus]AFU87910.1 hypothetical protein CcrColossus_gp040 [Caulobacter phage CcrColossus]